MSFLNTENFTMESIITLPTIPELTLENVGDVISESWENYYTTLESIANDDYELTVKSKNVNRTLEEAAFESAALEFAVVMESAGKNMWDGFVEQIKKMGQGFMSILGNLGSYLGKFVMTNKKFAETFGKKAKENPHAAGKKVKGYNFKTALEFEGGRAFQDTKTQLNKIGIALTSDLPSPEKVNELVAASKNQDHANELRGHLLGSLTKSATAPIKKDEFVSEMKKRFRGVTGDKLEKTEIPCNVDEAIKQLTSDSIVKKTSDAKKECQSVFDEHIKAIKAYSAKVGKLDKNSSDVKDDLVQSYKRGDTDEQIGAQMRVSGQNKAHAISYIRIAQHGFTTAQSIAMSIFKEAINSQKEAMHMYKAMIHICASASEKKSDTSNTEATQDSVIDVEFYHDHEIEVID